MTDKPIWMPLNVADYLKDTRHLSTLEHGAYLLLMMHAWNDEGALPGDKKRLRRVAGLSPRQWVQAGPILLDFFTLVDGVYRHKRIDQELEKAGRLIEQKRSAGKASAAARSQRAFNGRSTGVPTAGATERQREANQSQSQDSVSNETAAKASGPAKDLFDQGVAFLVGKGASPSAARSFIAKCRKDHGDKNLGQALKDAVRLDVTDPRPWMLAALKKTANDTGQLHAAIDRTFPVAGVAA